MATATSHWHKSHPAAVTLVLVSPSNQNWCRDEHNLINTVFFRSPATCNAPPPGFFMVFSHAVVMFSFLARFENIYHSITPSLTNVTAMLCLSRREGSFEKSGKYFVDYLIIATENLHSGLSVSWPWNTHSKTILKEINVFITDFLWYLSLHRLPLSFPSPHSFSLCSFMCVGGLGELTFCFQPLYWEYGRRKRKVNCLYSYRRDGACWLMWRERRIVIIFRYVRERDNNLYFMQTGAELQIRERNGVEVNRISTNKWKRKIRK